jgi:hypothetical protein
MTEDREPPNIIEIREFLQSHIANLKELVDHPEMIDDWTPVQKAWLMEHLELNRELLVETKARIERMLVERRADALLEEEWTEEKWNSLPDPDKETS